MTRVAIHSAIYGSYCPLLDPLEWDRSVSLTCHSDQYQSQSRCWKTAYDLGDTELQPRIRAKRHKMFAPVGADVTIWIDASLQLGNARRFVDFCLAALGNEDLALFAHPERTNIREEAEASLTHHVNKYAGLPVREQAEHYHKNGLPEQHQLYAGGVVVRRSSSTRLEKFNRDWWCECQCWTPQDQISLPWVLACNDIVPAIIPGNVYEGTDHKWNRGPDR